MDCAHCKDANVAACKSSEQPFASTARTCLPAIWITARLAETSVTECSVSEQQVTSASYRRPWCPSLAATSHSLGPSHRAAQSSRPAQVFANEGSAIPRASSAACAKRGSLKSPRTLICVVKRSSRISKQSDLLLAVANLASQPESGLWRKSIDPIAALTCPVEEDWIGHRHWLHGRWAHAIDSFPTQCAPRLNES